MGPSSPSRLHPLPGGTMRRVVLQHSVGHEKLLFVSHHLPRVFVHLQGRNIALTGSKAIGAF